MPTNVLVVRESNPLRLLRQRCSFTNLDTAFKPARLELAMPIKATKLLYRLDNHQFFVSVKLQISNIVLFDFYTAKI